MLQRHIRSRLNTQQGVAAEPFAITEKILHSEATEATERLNLATSMVPSPDWFLYGFVRKEAAISSQIEGTQATLEDVVSFEATRQA